MHLTGWLLISVRMTARDFRRSAQLAAVSGRHVRRIAVSGKVGPGSVRSSAIPMTPISGASLLHPYLLLAKEFTIKGLGHVPAAKVLVERENPFLVVTARDAPRRFCSDS